MSTLLFGLNAVLPILLLIGLGYILKRIHFLDEHFLAVGNKFVFFVALPVLLFYNIYSIDDLSQIRWNSMLYAVLALILLFALGFVIAMVFIRDPLQKGVVIQAIFRSNYAIIGIPLAEAIGGSEAVGVVAMITLVAVPLMNVLAVVSLLLFVQKKEEVHPLKTMLLKIIKNPLIIGVALGLIALWIRSFIPVNSDGLVFSIEKNLPFLYTAIVYVSKIASPLALIILGGIFEFFVIKPLWKQIVIGTFSRTVIAPSLALFLAIFVSKNTMFFHFDSLDFPALIALFGAPTAVSSAIMAKEMDNDTNLAVQLVVWTTIVSILSIFIIIVIFRTLGLI